MTFRHIVNQNLKHNFKRFLSYLFVNGFVVAVLFIYGSLLFNEILAEDVAMKLVMDYISISTYAIIMFSVAFVAYTGIYFVKSRGKEFSVYLTLGMTPRDLIRMVYLESLAIVAGSALCGIAAGLLLSKLFYLVLGRILGLSESIYFISYKTFLLSLGVFGIVFLCNMLFTSVFIRRLSIVQIGKAGSTKGLSKSRPVIGSFAIVVLLASMYLFYAACTHSTMLPISWLEYDSIIIVGSMVAVFAALYFVIPTGIDVVRACMARFPALYNRNLLILTNLKHRFFAYKMSLYMVSLLIMCAILSAGFGLSFYSYTHKTMEQNVPYDFMIESGGGVNEVSEEEVRGIVEASGGEVSEFSALRYLPNENYRDDGTRFVHHNVESILISETNFNRHTGLSVDVKQDELLLAYSQVADRPAVVDFDTLITAEPWREGETRAKAFEAGPVGKDAFVQSLGDTVCLSYEKDKTSWMVVHFINMYGNVEFAGVMANVVDDAVYEKVLTAVAERGSRAEADAKVEVEAENGTGTESETGTGTGEYTAYLFNLARGSGERVFAGILDALRARNHADSSLWASAETQFGVKDDAAYMRPIYKQERFDLAFRIDGLLLFSLAFLGLLFLLASSVVLFYKMVTDIDEEKEQIALLRRIGLTAAECRSYLQTHLAIVFFAPLVIGGLIGLYFMYASWGSSTYGGYLMGRVAVMFGLFVLMDALFYLSLRKKFFRGAGV